MGNCESTPDVVSDFPRIPHVTSPNPNPGNIQGKTSTPQNHNSQNGLHSSEQEEEFAKWLKEFQENNFRRMKHELKTDAKTFVLNLLLMCIQFFDNFDRSQTLAQDFKIAKEAQLNEKLAKIGHEGGIPGDRRVFLLHAMAETLAKNYIYRPSSQSQASDDIYESLAEIYKKMEENSSFMCEAILPLDFYMTWENIEAYPENEWRKLQDEDYSFAPGDSPTFRCCMEEPDPPKNKIPRGYVSLYCEEEASEISKLEAAKTGLTDDYSRGSDIYAPQTLYSDAKSSYNGSTNPSDDEDRESTRHMDRGQKMMHQFEKRLLEKGVTPQSSQTQNQRFQSALRTFSQNNNNNKPGTSNSNLINKLGPDVRIPEIVVQDESKIQTPLTPIPKDSNLIRPSILQRRNKGQIPNPFFPEPSVFKFENLSHQNGQNLLGPPRKNQRQNGGKSGAGESSNNIPPPPPPQLPSTSNDTHNNDFLSSGYESLATTSTPMSRSSSVMSEDVRLRYRNLELKELWEYKPTTTRLGRGPKKSPIPLQCLIKVKKQRAEDDDEDEDNEKDKDDDDEESSDDSAGTESNSDSSSNSSSNNNSKKKKASKKRLKNRRASSTDDNNYKVLNYLNSTQFCGIFCGDFSTLAKHMDMDASHAQVLGATVRCPVQYSGRSKTFTSASMFRSGDFDGDDDGDGDDEKFRVLYTFTPCIKSKYFPQKNLIPFRQRLLDKRREQDKPEGAQWPKRIQVDTIEEYGCHLTPLGFRSIQFFNTHQSLEWLTNFSMGESNLLSSFKQPHLRCYIFSSILFRAFISHMGPRGFGLEHIRNVMYLMCESDFIGWDDEQPGNHLKVLLNRLYDFLGRRNIPSFFNLGHNMLKNIPVENTQLVQAFLSKIRENLIVHCIYAFRNLTCLQPKGKWYPQADFKKLYRLVTKPREMDLLYISNPLLKGPKPEKNSKHSKKDKKGRKKKIDIIDHGGEIERETEQILGKKNKLDKQQRKFQHAYGKYAKKLEDKSREKKQEEEALKDNVPPTEKRKSINLGKLPVPKFTKLRMVMIIEFFVQHFLEMAEKSIEFQAYSNATMYTLHVQSLCMLLKGLPQSDESQVDDYLKVAAELLKKIGPNSSDYVKAKLSHFDLPGGMSELFLSQPSTSSRPNSRTGGKSSSFSDKNNNNNNNNNSSSNFTFASRKLPTPPASLSTSTPNMMNMRRDLNQLSFPLIPRVGMSMLALPTTPSMFSPNYNEDPSFIHGDFELSTLDRVHQRNNNYRSRPHLKYVQQDSPSHQRRQYRQHPGPAFPTSHNNFNSSRDMRPDSISPRPVSSNSYFSANNSIDSVPSSYNNDNFHW